MQNNWLFSSNNIYFSKCQKADEEKSEEDEQTLEELNSACRRSQAECPVNTDKPVTLNEFNCSCFRNIINILLKELSRSVWENLDLSRVYRPHCVLSVLTTSVKILPYRLPARLIRAKYGFFLLQFEINLHLWVFQKAEISAHSKLKSKEYDYLYY